MLSTGHLRLCFGSGLSKWPQAHVEDIGVRSGLGMFLVDVPLFPYRFTSLQVISDACPGVLLQYEEAVYILWTSSVTSIPDSFILCNKEM